MTERGKPVDDSKVKNTINNYYERGRHAEKE